MNVIDHDWKRLTMMMNVFRYYHSSYYYYYSNENDRIEEKNKCEIREAVKELQELVDVDVSKSRVKMYSRSRVMSEDKIRFLQIIRFHT